MMNTISINEMTASEIIDLVQYANYMMEHEGCYPVEYIVFRDDSEEELELENLGNIMKQMGYPTLQRKMDSVT